MSQTLDNILTTGLPTTTRDASPAARPQVRGKLIYVGDSKLYLRGVTYGTFRPLDTGHQYPPPDVVDRDFKQMADNGINVVRTYTSPPGWLLDAAYRHSIYVMVGMWWEQNTAFLESREQAARMEAKVREVVRGCAGHPAVLCYSIGNEITASIVRWYGRHRVERFLHRLYLAAKQEDPGGLVTYVNFPSTEYLQLPFLDFVAFNVYLESQEQFDAYLARLQNIAGDRPLVLAEMGLDSKSKGEQAQADTLGWLLRTAFEGGCTGAFTFAWTDEWHVAGVDIEDWDFGITGRDRRPKPALASVREAFAQVPFPPGIDWPSVSVVVCTYNGSSTIGQCLRGLSELDYPDYEVIVVDDGSTDDTPCIVEQSCARYIRTPNRGLSSARNTGIEAARGEIVAFIDDDAYPDVHWLRYLTHTLTSGAYAGVGGPNIAPPGDGPIADCVANAPGGPVHVLLSDRVAEHIPGCNMAFRKRCLQAVGGFDPQYRTAGDDVDLCWRIQERGWVLGFSPAAVVWHHRRNSVRSYWRQQLGYGKAEALLEKKWPEKYNDVGHLTWSGRLYGKGLTQGLYLFKGRVYSGTWGTAPFQSIYQPALGPLWSLPLMPEWYLVVIVLAALSALGTLWGPLLLALPLLLIAGGAPLAQASISASMARFTGPPRSRYKRFGLRILTMLLHLLQPLARLVGRVRYGLTPWRYGRPGFVLPLPRSFSQWRGEWQTQQERLSALEETLRGHGAGVVRGGDFDRWDLEVKGGLFGAARLRMAIEEHGASRQLVWIRAWPRLWAWGVIVMLLFAAGSLAAAQDNAWAVSAVLGGVALLIALRALVECAAALAAVYRTHRLSEERVTTGPSEAM